MITTTSQEIELAPTRLPGSQNAARLFVAQTLLQTNRLLTRWARDYITVIGAIVLPILFMVVLNIVLGNLAYVVTHDSGLYSIVPLIALGAAITGSTFVAIDLMRERSFGLLARLWVLPVHRASGLISRILANAIRTLVTTLVMLGTGVVLGFRFRQGLIPSLMWISVPVILGIAIAAMVTTVALYTAQTVVVEGVELVQAIAIFFSTGLVPLNSYPGWIQPFVAHQPVSYAIAAMRGFAMGGPVLSPMIGMLVWTAGICVVCAVPLAIGYRRASTH
ncbi:daunorubicin-DIM-transport integral membrane protein ABC transporter DRRC [Mycobacterium tuberculosis]|uniref:Probable doxorubicin resistance ABC transporter permease protein DrrC n=18 Tax=Mycobacterium tuberculosis complex TaxID=77643 RepID=DRRC_MYCTU|nr:MULTISPECIES: ABC transporter permease [Mycobacterium]NP_217454.1 daunorubicin ABC transporter permease DrrC [Mycobacterium tuberculosis H37Rv]P9WG20.1 RecName: Full=Probable doxorubicin resistance ABC transporter permease protein DrrC [Mycobacterium tuberculosis CDC1551]P9WG21.1 RecName: Full=Probable doxorubicin resistance ABC transporter permease protein DrrC [Mycobacterium tuberculosis H37Rv]AFE14084.1 putative daunorubicin-DIM-transport integral membrane protein ABC transporter DRRC [My